MYQFFCHAQIARKGAVGHIRIIQRKRKCREGLRRAGLANCVVQRARGEPEISSAAADEHCCAGVSGLQGGAWKISGKFLISAGPMYGGTGDGWRWAFCWAWRLVCLMPLSFGAPRRFSSGSSRWNLRWTSPMRMLCRARGRRSLTR
jgi:hypothetical protein